MRALRGPGQSVFAPSFLLAWMLAWCPSAFALDPALDVNQYAHSSWKVRDGFIKGRIGPIAQTLDGYLWLGTDFGLLRFDGVKNVPWQPPADQPLPSNVTLKLLAAGDGTLWIGTDKGLASWKDGKLTQYPQVAGQFIFAVLEDHDGIVWVGTIAFPTGKLCAIQNGGFKCYGENGELGRGVLGLYEDSRRNLWASAESGLRRWKHGPPKLYPLAGVREPSQALSEDDDGTLLLGMREGISRLVDAKTEAYPIGVQPLLITRMFRDRDG